MLYFTEIISLIKDRLNHWISVILKVDLSAEHVALCKSYILHVQVCSPSTAHSYVSTVFMREMLPLGPLCGH